MKTFTGDRTISGVEVRVDGQLLDEHLDVMQLCKDGFEWSYEGDAPAQLALAILCEHFGDPAKAKAAYKGFMEGVVANFNNEWEMTSADIDRALENITSVLAR